MEADHAFLDYPVGVCHTLMLAQMLHPGCDEVFDNAPFIGGILEHAPAVGAVAATLAPEFLKDLQKLLPVLRANTVFDCNQDRASILLDVVGGNRRRPVHRRRQVDASSRLQFPEPCQRYRNEHPSCRDKMRSGQSKTAAILPQTVLPIVRQPKNTVVYSASPRARPSPAERLVPTPLASQARQSMKRPQAGCNERRDRVVRKTIQCECDGGAQHSAGHHQLRTELCPQPWHDERSGHRASPDGAEKYSMKLRPACDLRAGNERQQRPIRTGK